MCIHLKDNFIIQNFIIYTLRLTIFRSVRREGHTVRMLKIRNKLCSLYNIYASGPQVTRETLRFMRKWRLILEIRRLSSL
jgi:hypothetical protein